MLDVRELRSSESRGEQKGTQLVIAGIMGH